MRKTHVYNKYLQKGAAATSLCTLTGLLMTAPGKPAAAQAASPPPVDADTVQAWHFDEGQGSTASDAASKLTASSAGGVSWVKGKYGSALKFNGSDARVKLNGDGYHVFGERDSFTVDAWVKVMRSGSTQQIYNGGSPFSIEVRPEGYISVNLVSLDGTQRAVLNGQSKVDDGKWHHIAFVRDVSSGKLQLFLDEGIDAEIDDPTAGKGKIGVSLAAMLGGTANNREMLEGSIDELRISKLARPYAASLQTGPQAPRKDYTLENSLVKMVFSASEGQLILSEFFDKRRNFSYIEKNVAGNRLSNLWQISMRTKVDSAQMSSAAIDEHDGQVSVKRAPVAGGEELQFIWKGLPLEDEAAPVDVTMRVMLPANSGMSQWRINVDNRSKIYGAWTVKFPSVTNLKKISSDGQQEYAVIPSGMNGGAGEGQLFRDPFATLQPQLRTYPCYYQSMQFNAYYGPKGGLYFGTHDGDANLKGFFLAPIKAKQPSFTYEVENYPANSGIAGTGYKQEWASVVGPFGGDWYDAAQIYRGWALKQKWARLGPLHQRKDIAPAIAKGAFWMVGHFINDKTNTGSLRRAFREMPLEQAAKATRRIDIEPSLDLVKKARDYFGYPIILWTSEWFDGGGDLSPPRYMPRENLPEFLKKMHQRFPDVTMSGYVAPKRVSTQIVEFPFFKSTLEHEANGHVPLETYAQEAGDEHTHPCWTTKIWTDHWSKLAYDRAALGLDGFHVDELASATGFAYQCFNTSHGHQIGGGTLYADTRRNMLKIIRDNARRANPNFAVHHEAMSEIYIDIDDLQEVCTSPTNNNIPLFQAVYHDYNFQMGRRIIQFMDVHTKWAKQDGNTNIDSFTAQFAETLIWGNQPGWVRMDLATYSPGAAAIAKHFMDGRYRSMKFLNVGQMLRPLTITKPLPTVTNIWDLNDTPEHTQPVILNSVWKAADGTVGIVLVNITNKPQTIDYKFNLQEAGLKGTKWSLRQIEGKTPVVLGKGNGASLQRSDVVAPRSMKVIEVRSN